MKFVLFSILSQFPSSVSSRLQRVGFGPSLSEGFEITVVLEVLRGSCGPREIVVGFITATRVTMNMAPSRHHFPQK